LKYPKQNRLTSAPKSHKTRISHPVHTIPKWLKSDGIAIKALGGEEAR